MARIDRYLCTNGDGTGTKSATGDYSGAEEIFFIQPAAGEIFLLERLIVYVVDVGAFDADKYGNDITLTNGIVLREKDDDGVIADITDGLPIKTNSHWARNCYDVAHYSYGTGNETLAARWTFSKAGSPIRLAGDENNRLEIVLHDKLDGLVEHTFLVQGSIE